MLSFIKQFLLHPRQTGAIARFSDNSIVKTLNKIDRTQDMRIIELWWWQGFFTKAILSSMSPESSLSVFEINKDFCNILSNIQDTRLSLINDSVLNIKKHFPEQETVDIVISTLPLALFSNSDIDALFSGIKDCLTPNGQFFQLQYSLVKEPPIKKHFPNYTKHRELNNIPPACIFHCKKD